MINKNPVELLLDTEGIVYKGHQRLSKNIKAYQDEEVYSRVITWELNKASMV